MAWINWAIFSLVQLSSHMLSCSSRLSNSHYKNRFFESPPKAGFQKNDFRVSSAYGAGNTKIVFIMRIAGRAYGATKNVYNEC
jgi:hypothetical protein